MLTIHPPAFIETGSCDGPRYTRGQPSREETGVTMTEIQDKYIPEFELPYRNIQRYIKEIGNDWNRLDENQRNSIRTSFTNMGLGNPTPVSTFANVSTQCKCTGKNNCKCGKGETFCSGKCKEGGGSIDPKMLPALQYLVQDPDNIQKVLNTIWNATPAQEAQLATNDQTIGEIKDSVYKWSVDNTYVLHSNWRSGLLLLFLVIIFLIIGIACGTAVPSEGSHLFGSRIFGRR